MWHQIPWVWRVEWQSWQGRGRSSPVPGACPLLYFHWMTTGIPKIIAAPSPFCSLSYLPFFEEVRGEWDNSTIEKAKDSRKRRDNRNHDSCIIWPSSLGLMLWKSIKDILVDQKIQLQSWTLAAVRGSRPTSGLPTGPAIFLPFFTELPTTTQPLL